jgi:hypothetical protein
VNAISAVPDDVCAVSSKGRETSAEAGHTYVPASRACGEALDGPMILLRRPWPAESAVLDASGAKLPFDRVTESNPQNDLPVRGCHSHCALQDHPSVS